MKKLYAITIICIMLFNSAVFYIYLVVQLKRIKVESKSLLKSTPSSQLEKIVLTQSEYQEALVEEGEIKLDGKMFDIGYCFHQGQQVTIYCKHDQKEDSLLALLDYVASTPIKSKDSVPHTVVEYISFNFIKPSLLQINPPELFVYNSVVVVYILDTEETFCQGILRPPISHSYFHQLPA